MSVKTFRKLLQKLSRKKSKIPDQGKHLPEHTTIDPTPHETPVTNDIGQLSPPESPGQEDEAELLLTLETLPIDVILLITDHLPIHSIALLALTSHRMFNTLGNHIDMIHEYDHIPERISFLEQLLKELPTKRIPCHHCQTIHVPRSPLKRRPKYEFKGSKNIHDNYCYRAAYYGGRGQEICFWKVQMAMKSYRLGLHPTPEMLLRSLRSKPKTDIDWSGFIINTQRDFKIVEGSLLCYAEMRILLKPGAVLRYWPYSGVWKYHLCPHQSLMLPGDGDFSIGECITHQNCSVPEDTCITATNVIPCDSCPMEFEIRRESSKNFKRPDVLIVKWWTDRGKGETVLDPLWWSHYNESYTACSVFKDAEGFGPTIKDRSPIKSSFPSIRNAYHGLDAFLPQERLPKSDVKNLVKACAKRDKIEA